MAVLTRFMESNKQSCWETLSATQRLYSAALSIGCLGILVIAGYLRPDARGYGTHEQLGLPPCRAMDLLGVPCPLCGMTTAFALMANGRALTAFVVQPAAAAVFVVIGAGAVGLGVCAFAALRPRIAISPARVTIMAGVILAAAWVYKLVVHLLL